MKANNAQHKIVVKNQQFHLPETKEKFIPITEDQVKINEPKQKIIELKSKPTEPRSKSPKKAVGLTKNRSNKKIKMAETGLMNKQSVHKEKSSSLLKVNKQQSSLKDPIRNETLYAPKDENILNETLRKSGDGKNINELMNWSSYRDPFQRLKPSIKPLFN